VTAATRPHAGAQATNVRDEHSANAVTPGLCDRDILWAASCTDRPSRP
jgi:hypothetical protein